MTPLNKIVLLIALGSVMVLAAAWWDSQSGNNPAYIKLGGVSFHTSIGPGINEAKNSSKPVFLYFRSETCYWCIRFEEEALSDKRVIDKLNKNFVLISIDTIKQKNVALNLGVRSTPFMIFFTKDGEELSRIPGYLQTDDFLVKLDSVLEKLNRSS
jgi:thioredoxin-related protein